jgi:hypothetical protein
MTAVDPLAPDLIPIREVPNLLPRRRRGRKLHHSTLWRWVTQGCGPSRARLAVVKIGSCVYTSKTALREFVARISESENPPSATPSSRTTTERQRDHEKATEELTNQGI